MGIKLTHKKREAELKGWKEHKKYIDEINQLQGKEKLEYEIKTLKSQIFNCEQDIKKFGEVPAIMGKINLLKQELNQKIQEYENCIN
jgi:hypothetical protein